MSDEQQRQGLQWVEHRHNDERRGLIAYTERDNLLILDEGPGRRSHHVVYWAREMDRHVATFFDMSLAKMFCEELAKRTNIRGAPDSWRGRTRVDRDQVLVEYREGRREFTYMDLKGSSFRDAQLDRVDFTGSRLVNSNFTRANLGEAVLAGADLRGAMLNYTNLAGADLRDANLVGCHLQYAVLCDANLDGAKVTYRGEVRRIRMERVDDD